MDNKYKKFLNIVKTELPNVNKDQIKIFDQGWDHVILLAGDVTFKFPRTKQYHPLLKAEANFLEEFSKCSPVKVPEMKFHIDPKSRMVYTTYNFLPGQPFIKDLYAKFTNKEKEEVALNIGNFLASLHKFPVKKAIKLGVVNEEFVSFWQKKINQLFKRIKPYLNKEEQTWAKKLFKQFLDLTGRHKVQMKVTHYDLYQTHILVDPTKHLLTSIIDFADMRIGDPAYDFCEISLYYGKGFLNKVFTGYKLKKGPYFEDRLSFYQSRWYLEEVRHALNKRPTTSLDKAKKALKQHIQNKKIH